VRASRAIALALLAAALPAQGDEARFAADAARRLASYAQQCERAGFAMRARRAWMEIVREYAPDDAKARAGLGHLRVGASWAPDPRQGAPAADDTAPAKLRPLERKWESLARALGDDHLKLAQKLAQRGEQDAANRHFARALRFRPDLAAGGEALGWTLYDGVWCDPGELEALRRSRRIRQVVAAVQRHPFPIEELPADARHPALERATVAHRGVRSAQFTVWGDYDLARLREAAAWAERCVALCRSAFGGPLALGERPLATAQLVFLRDLATWEKALTANRDLFEPEQFEFVLQYCSAAYLKDRDTTMLAFAETPDHMFDQTVRAIAVELAGVQSDALLEGVGHAVVGWCFDRNLIYMLDPEKRQTKGHTVVRAETEAGSPVMPPDFSVWFDRAVNNAWTEAGARVAELPLRRLARMPVDDRINAWSVCDFLLRREPKWLHALDAGHDAGTAGEVGGQFARVAGQDLAEVEALWRRWWMEDERLWGIAAGRGSARPIARDKERELEALLDAVNAVRHAHGLGWIGWEPVAVAPPRERALAARAPWKAAELVVRWFDLPGYRHAILDPALDMLGAHLDGAQLALDPQREGRDVLAPAACWPARDMHIAAGSARVADVPGLAELLATRGAGAPATVGRPLTLHVRGREPDDFRDPSCAVTVDGAAVDGVLVAPGDAAERALCAPGLATFWPLAPVPAGARVEVAWTWRDGLFQRELRAGFAVR
jgi:hypothetical protein